MYNKREHDFEEKSIHVSKYFIILNFVSILFLGKATFLVLEFSKIIAISPQCIKMAILDPFRFQGHSCTTYRIDPIQVRS